MTQKVTRRVSIWSSVLLRVYARYPLCSASTVIPERRPVVAPARAQRGGSHDMQGMKKPGRLPPDGWPVHPSSSGPMAVDVEEAEQVGEFLRHGAPPDRPPLGRHAR